MTDRMMTEREARQLAAVIDWLDGESPWVAVRARHGLAKPEPAAKPEKAWPLKYGAEIRQHEDSLFRPHLPNGMALHDFGDEPCTWQMYDSGFGGSWTTYASDLAALNAAPPPPGWVEPQPTKPAERWFTYKGFDHKNGTHCTWRLRTDGTGGRFWLSGKDHDDARGYRTIAEAEQGMVYGRLVELDPATGKELKAADPWESDPRTVELRRQLASVTKERDRARMEAKRLREFVQARKPAKKARRK